MLAEFNPAARLEVLALFELWATLAELVIALAEDTLAELPVALAEDIATLAELVIALVELCPALAEELAFVNEFRTALVELCPALALDVIALLELRVAAFCELVMLVLAEDDAGAKLVGITTDDPRADNVPVVAPVVDPTGMTDPANGMNLPPWIVPPIGFVDPAGVNVATVPLGMFPPVNVTSDISVPPSEIGRAHV